MEALIAWFGEIHWVAVLQIILIDILLGGDNAVVIALACRSLDPHLRVKGIIYGAGGAILLRVILIAFAVSVMNIPFLKFCGGLLLLQLYHLFVTLLPFGFFLWFLGILLHPLVQLVLVHDVAETVGLPDRNDIAEQVVIAQSARVIVEPKQQHDRHQVKHHELHPGHLRGRTCCLCVVDPR